MTQFTVPAQPDNTRGWRKTVTGLTNEPGGASVQGDWLQAGDTVDLQPGTLVVTVDKVTIKWDYGYRTGEKFRVEDATVTILLITSDAPRQLWTRHFKQATNAFGTTTTRNLAAALTDNPPPAGRVELVAASRRPNRRAEPCSRCRLYIPVGVGHLVGHGQDAAVEHWQACPPRPATTGTPCTLCGVTVRAATAVQILNRSTGVWETQHVERLDCVNVPQESAEQYAARTAAARAAQAAQDAADRQAAADKATQAAARAAARAAAKRAAHDAEQARVAGLATTARTERTLNDKGLGAGRRVSLVEYTDTLSDGSTTHRWAVRVYATAAPVSMSVDGDYDDSDDLGVSEFTDLDDARDEYRAYRFAPEATPGPGDHSRRSLGACDDSRRSLGACDECGQRAAHHRRRDSSGIFGVVCDRCNREPDYLLSFA